LFFVYSLLIDDVPPGRYDIPWMIRLARSKLGPVSNELSNTPPADGTKKSTITAVSSKAAKYSNTADSQ
jgi:hypothetical protein